MWTSICCELYIFVEWWQTNWGVVVCCYCVVTGHSKQEAVIYKGTEYSV